MQDTAHDSAMSTVLAAERQSPPEPELDDENLF